VKGENAGTALRCRWHTCHLSLFTFHLSPPPSRCIRVLPRMQRPELVRLHIEKAAEHSAKIIRITVAAGGGDLFDV
jgi:hypothetical protein